MMRFRSVLAALGACLAVPAAFAGAARPPTTDAATGIKTFTLPDGSTAKLGPDGLGWRTDRSGLRGAPFTVLRPQGQGGMGGRFGPSDLEIQRRLALPHRGRFAPGRVIISVPGATQVSGAAATKAPRTGDALVDETLRAVGARSMRGVSAGSNLFVVDVAGDDPVRAARKLRATPGVAYAEPDWIVASMATEPRPIPQTAIRPAKAQPQAQAATAQPLPTNFGLQSSMQSWLNATGVNAIGAYADIARRFGQLPGEGVIVTNVSIGDLTDQAMADAGDFYVAFFGPTTRVIGAQRYLDFPSLPLIPTYTVDASGAIDPLGTVEFVDPRLGEVLLDFSVMAPLPHDRQRPEAQGAGPTDLLGIAPGAQYRLVVPKEPTISNILTAMLAAAQQSPRPDVISASLGFGTDSVGFPGRYLEDDPIAQSVVSTVVHKYGVVVAISANDGTRLFTPAAVGPDGGSTPTDLLPRGAQATSVDDDALSTTPTLVADSGAFAVGGVTLDDIFSAPPQSGGTLAGVGQFPTTRFNGGGGFSSGFGTRVNISAPSDNIASFIHGCDFGGCSPSDVIPVLNGGTSASAPMTAAAAAVVLQVARLTHQRLTPAQVRDLLVRTARPTVDAPQSGRSLHVGPQLDVTAAVESLLGIDKRAAGSIVRVSVAHRQAFQELGATFVEATDPAAIDLLGPTFDFGGGFQFSLGQNAVAPITIAADVINLPRDSATSFALRVGSQVITSAQPSFRLLPEEILSAAGLTLADDGDRTVPLTIEARRSGRVVDSRSVSLTFGPTDGTYAEALAPSVQPVVATGSGVVVHYDLRSVRGVNNPVLVVSSINHFSPVMAPFYRSETSVPLKTLVGDVTVPASAFAAGAGLYGIGTITDPDSFIFGEFAIVRVGPGGAPRPDAPTLDDGIGSFGHSLAIARAAPKFSLRWDVRSVSGADGAMLEFSAPGPTLLGTLNTFTNQNGDRRDANGVESASTLFQALAGTAGTVNLDATQLQLASSLFYNVRVLATQGGKVVGQASPSSALEFDDGLAPGSAILSNFDITPSSSTAALVSFDVSGLPVDTSLTTYSPGSGTYGTAFADDPSGRTLYSVIGSDPSLHAAAVIRFPFYFDAPQEVQVYDTRTGAQRSSVAVDLATQAFLVNGRVDSRKHRAALLAISSTDFTDQVIPVDLSTGGLGPWVNADLGLDFGGVFNSIDVDAASGRAILGQSLFGDICIGGGRFGQIGEVDLDDGSVLPVTPSPHCMTAFAADQRGRDVYTLVGPVFSFPFLIPPGRLQDVDQARLMQLGPEKQLGANGPVFAAVDPVNGLLVVGFLAGKNYLVNNVAMSAVGVYDARSGRQISLSERFNFVNEAFSSTLFFIGERGIQLDPSTRTAWTLGPGGAQVQQFSY